jgi:hypothetical protein
VGTKWSAMFSGIEKYLEEKPWKFRSVLIILRFFLLWNSSYMLFRPKLGTPINGSLDS